MIRPDLFDRDLEQCFEVLRVVLKEDSEESDEEVCNKKESKE